MTDKEKALIADYRKQGCGYKSIAQLTGLSQNTVKSYCRRSGLAPEPSDTDGKSCLFCGARIEPVPGRKPRKFCSDKCRNRWWNSHLDIVKRKANYTFICPCCKKPFTVYGNANRKYCSHGCYIEDRFGGEHHD